MAIEYHDGRWVFDVSKKFKHTSEIQLLKYAENYLKYLNIVKDNVYDIQSDLIVNWTILVNVTTKTLGFKRKKTYSINLFENKVYLVKGDNKKQISRKDAENYISFFEFVSTQTSDLDELNIRFEESNHNLYPGAIS